jgi:hypothetical protein
MTLRDALEKMVAESPEDRERALLNLRPVSRYLADNWFRLHLDTEMAGKMFFERLNIEIEQELSVRKRKKSA